MDQPIIGANTGDFRLPVKESLQLVSTLQFKTIELPVVEGEISPKNLTSSGRRHLARLIENHGLHTSVLQADMPNLHLTDSKTVDERLQRTIEIIQLAHDLHVPIVTSSFGALTHPDTLEPSPVAIEALGQIGEVADTYGIQFAIRPSYDSGDRLLNILHAVRCPSIKIGMDPASMVMVGINPLASIERFVSDVSLFYVRDGTSGLRDQTESETRPGHEMPLGQGDVDFHSILQILRDGEYRGPYVVRRTHSSCPADDIVYARDTFQQMYSS